MKSLPLIQRFTGLVSLIFAVLTLGHPSSSQSDRPVASELEFEWHGAGPSTDPVSFTFEGVVVASNGEPAEEAVVVSSAGGLAVTDAEGRFRFAVDVPVGALSVQVSAVSGTAGESAASQSVAILQGSGILWVGRLQLENSAACTPSWLPTFGQRPGVNLYPTALTVFDDGSGAALYVGGSFSLAGGLTANSIAKWDGSTWTAFGGGVFGVVSALTVFDDGSGEALYVGGSIQSVGGLAANNIAKWDGSSWAALGTGVNNDVNAMTVFDDGSGDALFVGGRFTSAGGASANRIAKWDGTSWSALGYGVDGPVYALTVFDDGGGTALIAGGDFATAGAVSASRTAKWDGSSWTAIEGGIYLRSVYALAVFDDGGGSALYAGGKTGSGTVSNIAKWDGSRWTNLGTGIRFGRLHALTVFDDGGGEALFAAGGFGAAGSVSADGIAKWDGSNWAPLGSGTDGTLYAMAVFDGGDGEELFVAGFYTEAGGAPARNISSWNGSTWGVLGNGLYGAIHAMTQFDDGNGRALYAGGYLMTAGGIAANNIAKWDGSSWTALGSGIDGIVHALAVFDDGSGAALIAAGSFYRASGVIVSNIAKWDGSSWIALGGGMSGTIYRGRVRSLKVFDDGGGEALFAGGDFNTAGGVSAKSIAKWDGSNWTALEMIPVLGSVRVSALEVYDDGGGACLIAGGDFDQMGSVTTPNIAKWDGSNWTALRTGLVGPVNALAVFDDGDGDALWAGGWFPSLTGTRNLARWKDSRWSPVPPIGGPIYSLKVFDDGGGAALFVAGGFEFAGGLALNDVAKWNGSNWSPLGSGLNPVVRGGVTAMEVFDDGNGAALFVAGNSAESGDSALSKWGCLDTTAPVIVCPTFVFANDRRTTGPGEVVHFSVTATDDVDPEPNVASTPPSGSFFYAGTTLVTSTATDAVGNQSTCQFSVVVGHKAKRPSGFKPAQK